MHNGFGMLLSHVLGRYLKFRTTFSTLLMLKSVISRHQRGIYFSGTELNMLRKQWSEMALQLDDKWEHKFLSSLSKVAGIYTRNREAGLNLQKTVLTSVVSPFESKSGARTTYYDAVLKNFLCFTGRYSLQPLLFLIGTNTQCKTSTTCNEAHSFINEMHEVNPSAAFVSYPYRLFWELLKKKNFAHGAFCVLSAPFF